MFTSEILTTQKPSGAITRAIRKITRYFIDGDTIKEKSKEAFIIEELFNGKDIKIQNIRDEIEIFIHRAAEKTNINDLYEKLTSSPYGLTRQAISLLLLDVLLRHGDNASIFEKGLFLLNLDALTYDRLMVNPHKFEIQKNVFTDERKTFINKLSKVLGENTDNLLETTKTLVNKIKGLDKYTKNTINLSENTLRLRSAVMNAKEPYKLIFNDVPVALGYKNYESCTPKFFKILKRSLSELECNYSALIAEIEQFFFGSFDLKPGQTNRETLTKRVKVINEFISNDEIMTIANNIKIDNLPYVRWIERIATVINKTNVPKNWSDNDLADFKQKIILISDEIKRLELITSKVKGTSPNIPITEELKAVMNTLNNLSTLQKMLVMSVLQREIA